MSQGGTGAGGIIIKNERTGKQIILTETEGNAIVDALMEAGEQTIAAKVQPVVDDAG